MWLLEEYHGQGIGYQVISQLPGFATAHGYTRVRLQTSPEQTRAVTFYKRVGLYEIPCYNDKDTEVSMEIKLHREAT